MPAVVPRWEWRVFGDNVRVAEGRFAALAPEREGESDELYLLSRSSDDSVKVRDELLDVKHLERVSDEGLQQWRPVLKAAFPLSAADVGTLLAALRVTDATPEPVPTLDELLDRLVRPRDELRGVEVHKRRRHYTLDGCMAEVTDLRADGRDTRTIAVESEDPERVLAVVRELGLDSASNASVPRILAELVGFGSRRDAVIDVGTNSVKFLVAEVGPDGSWRTIVERAEITRLGEGLDETGTLGEDGMERTLDAIAGMAEEARREGAAEIAAVGTAALRRAADGAVFIAAVEERCGVRIDVISGEEEARLAFLAATSSLDVPQGSMAVFETGGGSAQFTFGHGTHVEEQFSVDVGAVGLTERFRLDGPVSDETLSAALDAIAGDLAALDGRAGADTLVGVGGTVTNLAAVKHELAVYDPDVVHGAVLDRTEVDRQIELYRTRSAEERRRIVGLQPGREAVILAGTCVVRTVLTKLGRESFTVSDRGLRHGVLVERFGSVR